MIKILFILTLLVSTLFSEELKLWIMPNGANSKGKIEEILKPFEKSTSTKVTVEVLDWGSAWNKISNALNGTSPAPNVLQLGTTWIGHFAQQKQLTNLTDKIYNPKRFYSDFLTLSKLYGENDIYSIPFFSDTRAFLANKKYLDSLQVSPDLKTYSDFISLLNKVKNKHFTIDDGTIVSPYGFPGKQDWNIPHNFAPWIWSDNGSFIKYENSQWHSALLDKGSVTGIVKYIHFILDSLATTKTLQENSAVVSQRFIRGEIAVIYSTIELIKKLEVDSRSGGLKNTQIGNDGIYIFNVPQGSLGSVSFSGGSHLAIPKKFANNTNSIKLLNYLTSPSIMKEYCNSIGFFPPDTTLWNKDDIGEDMMPIIEIAKHSRSYPQIAQWGNVESILIRYFTDIWSLVESGYNNESLYNKTLLYNSEINALFDAKDSISLNFVQFDSICNSVSSKSNFRNETLKKEIADNINTLPESNFNMQIVLYSILIILFIFLMYQFIKRM